MPEQALTNATGHKLEGEIAVVRELTMEDKILDYEKVLVTKLSGEVKEALRKLNVSESIILGITTIELAELIPDTNTGRLRKIESLPFQTR